ncbi:hypothetical protein [Shinella sp.]|uniref:hypothetical protein n=1 Tax=Shinella sp. TaxID=1870904 RepID=UPI003F6EBB8C
MHKVKVFYDNRRGVRVTDRVFSTRLRDEQLSAIVSVKVGREPLFIVGPIGSGLSLFGLGFSDVLEATHAMALIFIGSALIAGGYCLASLTVGTLFNDKAVFWRDLWTIQRVRRALRDAMHVASVESSGQPSCPELPATSSRQAKRRR